MFFGRKSREKKFKKGKSFPPCPMLSDGITDNIKRVVSAKLHKILQAGNGGRLGARMSDCMLVETHAVE